MNKTSGRSLIELSAILMIIAILSAISFNSFYSRIQKSQAQHAIEQTLQALSFARQTSLNQGVEVSFCGFNESTTKNQNKLICQHSNINSWAVFKDDNTDGLVSTPDELIRVIKASHDKNTFSLKASFKRTSIRFLPSGQTLETGSLTYCPSKADNSITNDSSRYYFRVLKINRSGRAYELGNGNLGEVTLNNSEISNAIQDC